MAAKKTTAVNNEDTLDLAVFFSRDNENNGVWYEPQIKGIGCGFEFKICGVNSNTATKADEKWNKKKAEVAAIENEEVRNKKEDEIFAERVTGYIVDIRGKDGKKIVIKGKEITKDDIYNIIYNSPALAVEVTRFATKIENFLGIEKNA